MMSIPRLHASEQRRLFEGKLAMDARQSDDTDTTPGQSDAYREERDRRRAEAFADIEAESGTPAVTV